MQILKRLVFLLALTGIFHAPLQAHDKNFGYLHDKNGELIVNSLGECIRTTSWTPETAIPSCEGDADQDGIADGSDQCPATPTGVMVDAMGCEKDSDNDGIADSADNCPATPTGVMVDAMGCEKDSDKDGIADSADNCPATPAGVMVDAAGCEKDSDNDGIADSADKCPGTVAGVEVDIAGCAIVVAPLDTDNDGIVDLNDQCPDSKPGANVDAKGCELKESYVLEGVNFVSGSDALTGSSESVLDSVAETLTRNEELIIEVAGYTDSRGESGFNRSLSQKRAEAVMAYLQSAGVASNRMTAKGYGEDSPIADNSTAEGRARNRRVELHIID